MYVSSIHKKKLLENASIEKQMNEVKSAQDMYYAL
jgi:hypothetical protein